MCQDSHLVLSLILVELVHDGRVLEVLGDHLLLTSLDRDKIFGGDEASVHQSPKRPEVDYPMVPESICSHGRESR